MAEKDEQLHAAQERLKRQLQEQLQRAEAEMEVRSLCSLLCSGVFIWVLCSVGMICRHAVITANGQSVEEQPASRVQGLFDA